jgi:hypothetical protein
MKLLNTKVYMWLMTLLIFFWINFEGVGAFNSTHPTVFHFFNMDVSVSLDTGQFITTSGIPDAGLANTMSVHFNENSWCYAMLHRNRAASRAVQKITSLYRDMGDYTLCNHPIYSQVDLLRAVLVHSSFVTSLSTSKKLLCTKQLCYMVVWSGNGGYFNHAHPITLHYIHYPMQKATPPPDRPGKGPKNNSNKKAKLGEDTVSSIREDIRRDREFVQAGACNLAAIYTIVCANTHVRRGAREQTTHTCTCVHVHPHVNPSPLTTPDPHSLPHTGNKNNTLAHMQTQHTPPHTHMLNNKFALVAEQQREGEAATTTQNLEGKVNGKGASGSGCAIIPLHSAAQLDFVWVLSPHIFSYHCV